LRARNGPLASMKSSICPLAWLLTGVALVSFLVGCESRPERRGPRGGGGAADPALRPIAMVGEAVFFDGQVAAQVLLTRGIGSAPGERPGGGAGEGRGGGMGGGRGGGGRGGGMGGGRGGMGEMGGMGSSSPGNSEGGDSPRRAGSSLGSPMPPVTLCLNLTDNAKDGAPLEIEVVDFESDLGNFALKPDHVTLAPGQTGGPRPVVSRLGVTSDEIPVKVTLRLAGKKETQSVALRHKPVPAVPPPETPAGE
jgi:hypothetical protein